MQSTGYMRQVTQALHAIAEQLAAKEIDIAPQQFLHRETIKRSMSKMNKHDMVFDEVNREGLAVEEETKRGAMGVTRKSRRGTNADSEDDEDDFFDALDHF